MVRALSKRGLAAAVVLAGFAGYVDGFAFVFLGGYFVSFMTGNTTRGSVEVSHLSLESAAFAFALVAAFVAGVMAGTLVPGDRARGQLRVLLLILVLVCAAALLAGFDGRWATGCCLALAMGALNTVFARGGQVAFGVTYMTGALVKVGQGLVGAMRGNPGTGWQRHLLMWASIAVGAVLGAAAFAWIGHGALWIIAAALAALLAVRGIARPRRAHQSGPTRLAPPT
ncbi:YoaK family protein [Microbacterium sp. NPDC056044]|uniref:YoaK family protein n=1 Tax=Microbacterium sp. NPDC056044 TaxID=3345690 RepID=UPI0035D72513